MAALKKKPRRKLTPSRLEGMGEDVDISDLALWFNGVQRANLEAAMTDCRIRRTIEGASTITVPVVDQDGILLRSGRLSSRQDVAIDGLWFRLAQVGMNGKNLTLVFEDREVAILRTYTKPIKQSGETSRSRETRAQFILKMLQEVKEESIPYFIPALNVKQPVDKAPAAPAGQPVVSVPGSKGIPQQNDLTVKGARMTDEQRINANTILSVGAAQGMQRMFLVIAIMVAIQESNLKNLGQPTPGDFNWISADPNDNPVGVFQQRKKYWPEGATQDVAIDATAFYKAAGKYLGSGMQYYQIAEAVQNSGNGAAYAKWRTESDRIVDAWGNPSTTTRDANNMWSESSSGSDYEFYRGIPPTSSTRKQKYGQKWGPESSWDCMQRLANEVNWRAFFTTAHDGRNTFYYIDEEELFRSEPLVMLTPRSPGIDWANTSGDYDENKKTASLNLSVRMARWAAPPGSIVVLKNWGPWNGRWIVNEVNRSAYNSLGTIVLKKPLPKLPEPSQSNLITTDQSNTWGQPPSTTQYPPGTYVDPLKDAKSVQPERTDQGVDYGLDVFSAIVAIGNCVILTATDASSGWPGGGLVTYQLLDGTHTGAIIYTSEYINVKVKKGDRLKPGDIIAIARVTPGGSSTLEMGYSTSSGQPITPYPPGASHDIPTEGGKRFARFLITLGRPVRDDPGDGSSLYLG